MKRVVILCCCALLLLQAADGFALNKTLVTTAPLPSSQVADHGGKIDAKYDGFSYETVVALKKMGVTCGGKRGMQGVMKDTCVSLAVSLHCPGQQLDYVRYAKLQLVFEAKDWDQRHPIDARELMVVADGATLKLGRMALVNQNAGDARLVDVMREVLEVSLPYQTFLKIARAQIVEMRVGRSVVALQEKNLSALRDLNNRVKL